MCDPGVRAGYCKEIQGDRVEFPFRDPVEQATAVSTKQVCSNQQTTTEAVCVQKKSIVRSGKSKQAEENTKTCNYWKHAGAAGLAAEEAEAEVSAVAIHQENPSKPTLKPS